MSLWVASASMDVYVRIYVCFYELFMYIRVVYVSMDVYVWIYGCENVFFVYLWVVYVFMSVLECLNSLRCNASMSCMKCGALQVAEGLRRPEHRDKRLVRCIWQQGR
jgi:hypothetical protein